MRHVLLRLFFALSCGLSAHSAPTPEDTSVWDIPKDRENFHIFLLMGQSNMSGFGILQPDDREPVPQVLNIPTKGPIAWQPAAHPLHNRTRSDRFGLGLPFAKEYLKAYPGVTVGLISIAWGGAPIDKLNKGTPSYADAIKKAQFAKTQGVVKGMLWHQGESDTVNAPKAHAYEGKLHQLISDLRTDLGQKNLPVIVGNLAEFYGTGSGHNAPERVKQINQVRATLRAVPNKVSHTGFAESTGGASPDRHLVHFDRASYIILGKRYADAFHNVTTRKKP